MDPKIFQKLSNYEHRRLIDELDQAAEHHLDWLAKVNRALVCGPQAHDEGEADFSELPHTQCHLGRWYFGVEDARITAKPGFVELGQVHRQIHQLAAQLLARRSQGEAISAQEYNPLIQLSEQLRTAILGIGQDLKTDLVVSARLLAKLFENANEGVVVISPDMHILHVNQSFVRITGYSEKDVLGNAPDVLYADKNDVDFYQELWINVRTRGFWQGELTNRRKQGDQWLEQLSIYAITDDSQQISHFLAIFSDITGVRETEDKLYKLAHFDSVTGLPNRMLFQDRLTQEIAHARRHRVRAAILFLDLDDFKSLNDQYGRSTCDLLLERLSKRLAGLLRSTDSIGRFGGDEFLILLELTNEGDYRIVANKVLEAVAEPFDLNGHTLEVTGSLGVSLFPSHSSDAAELIRRADLAMYRAKIGGKNGYRVYSDDPG